MSVRNETSEKAEPSNQNGKQNAEDSSYGKKDPDEKLEGHDTSDKDNCTEDDGVTVSEIEDDQGADKRTRKEENNQIF